MAANFETEEAIVYATYCEFLKFWGNGSQASLNLHCYNGQAWVQLMSALGHPTSPHQSRHDHPHHGYRGHDHHHPRHGYRGPHLSQHKKKKGARQRDRDRARAALHRASLASAATAERISSNSHQPAPPVPAPATPPDTPQLSVEDDSDVDDVEDVSYVEDGLHENVGDNSESEEELESPRMMYVWHSPTPARQMLTRLHPIFPPDPPPPKKSPHAKKASLHQVIQALHEKAAHPADPNFFATPRRKRQYGGAYCLEQTCDGTVRHELTSKKQLARRGGYWDVMGEVYYIDNDYEDNISENSDTVSAHALPSLLHVGPHNADGQAVPDPCGQVGAPHPLHAGLPLPGGQPRDTVSWCLSAELPAEDQIAEMSYEELVRFAGGEDWKQMK